MPRSRTVVDGDRNLDRQRRNALKASIREDARPVPPDEDDIGLDDRRLAQNHVEGRRDDLPEVVGADVPVENPHQVADGALMAKRRAGQLDKFSLLELVALAVLR